MAEGEKSLYPPALPPPPPFSSPPHRPESAPPFPINQLDRPAGKGGPPLFYSLPPSTGPQPESRSQFPNKTYGEERTDRATKSEKAAAEKLLARALSTLYRVRPPLLPQTKFFIPDRRSFSHILKISLQFFLPTCLFRAFFCAFSSVPFLWG